MGIYFLLRFVLKPCCSLKPTLKTRRAWIVHCACLRHCVFRAESNYCHLVSQFLVLCYWKLLVFHLCLQGDCMSSSHFFLVYFPCIFTVFVLPSLSVCPLPFSQILLWLFAWSSLLNGVLVYNKVLFAASCFPTSAFGLNVSSQCALA